MIDQLRTTNMECSGESRFDTNCVVEANEIERLRATYFVDTNGNKIDLIVGVWLTPDSANGLDSWQSAKQNPTRFKEPPNTPEISGPVQQRLK
uniref:Uncharacterized protein n=1 Tax=Timema cristinae TaxID=61476 RepID=A0A7R9D2P1_TIMCR|nr:unnamed protein product [Timema cristinae]